MTSQHSFQISCTYINGYKFLDLLQFLARFVAWVPIRNPICLFDSIYVNVGMYLFFSVWFLIAIVGRPISLKLHPSIHHPIITHQP